MKKILSIVLSLAMAMQSISMVSAEQINQADETIITRNQAEIEKEEQEAVDAYIRSLNRRRVNDYEYKSVKEKETISKIARYGYAGGQPAGGTIFGAGGGGFYWTDGGPQVTASVSFNFGVVSIAAGVGSVTATGWYKVSPYINIPCKLVVGRSFKRTEYKMYRRKLVPTLGEWEYYEDFHKDTLYQLSLTVEKV